MNIDSNFDPSTLRAAINTTEQPHQTLCFVKAVTDTHIEASFSVNAMGWVSLPVTEVVSAEVAREVELFHGSYSLVRLTLHENHPITEIAALRAQVNFLRNSTSRSCASAVTGTSFRHGAETQGAEIQRRPVDECIHNCEGVEGCRAWLCYLACIFVAKP